MRVRSIAGVGSLLVLLASLLAPPAAYAAEFDVAVDDFFFSPEELFVNAGDTVTWTWVGQAPHNVTPVEPGVFEASATITEGTHEVTFTEEGSVPYYCTLHAAPDGSEGMVGVVNVLAEGEELPEPAPEPRPAPDPGRLPSAEDAVGTALVWSSLFPDDGAPTVALGRDDVFADSLTSGAVQGLVDGPLLLTPTGSLDQRVIDELARLGAETVVIFGGVAAISAEVEQQLIDLGYTVDRVSGDNRVETAVDSAATFFPDAREAFIVREGGIPGGDETQGFADSLAVGGAAARASIPILISQTGALSEATRAHLEANPSISRVYLVGGEAALSPQVQTDLEALGIEVVRIAGPTRFHTAVEVVDAFYRGGPIILIDGQAPDAWVAGFAAASAAESAGILLANGDDLPVPTVEPFSFGVPVICGPSLSTAACEKAEIAATSAQFGEPGSLLAILDGDSEVPGPGADGATGDFFLKPTSAPDALCYEIAVYGLVEPVTGAHIHEGAEGEAGDVVIPLAEPDDSGFVASCAFDLDPAVVADVLANPSNYYANYHTATHPAGAVRGQLFDYEVIGFAELSPDAEVPPADIAGGGFMVLVADADDDTRLAYYMGYGLADGSQAVAGHIHEAPEGENGPVVLELQLPVSETDEGFEGSFVIEGVDSALVAALKVNTSDYYVNLHTEAFPDGALRGQLFNPFAGGPDGPPEEDEADLAAFAAHRR